jgi:hypothetical protein
MVKEFAETIMKQFETLFETYPPEFVKASAHAIHESLKEDRDLRTFYTYHNLFMDAPSYAFDKDGAAKLAVDSFPLSRGLRYLQA